MVLKGGTEADIILPFEEFSERARFNVAPSQFVPVIRIVEEQPKIAQMRWGFIPAWAKERPKLQPINVRSETAGSSPMFRYAFERQRCLMPADGFYEWQGANAPRQPWFIRRKDDLPFAFAAIWSRWRPAPDVEPVETCALLTTTPNTTMQPLHNRMPVILKEKDYRQWLDPKTTPEQLKALLAPYGGNLVAERVSPLVNSPKNEDPKCCEPV